MRDSIFNKVEGLIHQFSNFDPNYYRYKGYYLV